MALLFLVAAEVRAQRNESPVVRLNAPLGGAVLLAGSPVRLDATATDSEDDDLGAAVAWTSNLDGPLGNGPELTVNNLSMGLHVITAAALDRGGRSGEASVSVTIEPATRAFLSLADTTVAADNANQSLGTARDLVADTVPQRFALLRFAVSGVGHFRIAQARVRLTVGQIRSAASDAGGTLYRVDSSAWSEATTYLNRPPVDGRLLATAGRVRPNQVVDFDVTAAVAGDGVYDLALLCPSGDGVRYQSREAQSGRPQLLVTLEGADVPPEVKKSEQASTGTLSEINADASPVRMSLLRFRVAGVAPFAVQQAPLRLGATLQKGSRSDSAGTVHGISSGTRSGATISKSRPVVDGMPLASAGAVSTGQSVDFGVTRALHTASSKNVRCRGGEAGSARPRLVGGLLGNTANVPQDFAFDSRNFSAITPATGIAVLASSSQTASYWHNTITPK